MARWARSMKVKLGGEEGKGGIAVRNRLEN